MKNKILVVISIAFLILISVIVLFYSIPNYARFEQTELKPEYGNTINLQFGELEAIYTEMDSLGIMRVDSNSDSWKNKLVKKNETLLSSQYPIFPALLDENYLIVLTGLNSFDWGGIWYFILPKYTQIILFDRQNGYQIVFDRKLKEDIGKVFIEEGDLIFLYGNSESISVGRLNIR